MKKHIITLLIVSVFAGVSAQDAYHPITEGCIWSVSNEKYMTAGDTVLNGKTYLKIYRQERNLPFEFSLDNAEFFAAIHNDSAEKKVYAYVPAGTWIRNLSDYSVIQTDSAMDVLVYDFSLEIGDTLTYYIMGDVVAKAVSVRTESASIYVGRQGYSSVSHQYTAEDSVVYLSDNSARRQILLQGLSYSTQNDLWIEGIGGIRGFDEGPQLIISDYGKKTLLCFSDNSGVTFQTEYDLDNEPNDCFSNGFGGDVPERTIRPISVYPNPTDDLLFVELSGAGITHAVVYDLQGRIVADMSNAGGRFTATVNVHSIPAGVYLLRVTDTDGKEYHQKIVKK